MQNYKSKFKSFKEIKPFIFDGEKKVTKVNPQIYSEGKSPNPSGDFKCDRAEKIN